MLSRHYLIREERRKYKYLAKNFFENFEKIVGSGREDPQKTFLPPQQKVTMGDETKGELMKKSQARQMPPRQ